MDEKPIVINIPSVDECPLKDLNSVCKHYKLKDILGYAIVDREKMGY
ncbi:hypothetical protein V7124_24850 [Neobacillus niacini]